MPRLLVTETPVPVENFRRILFLAHRVPFPPNKGDRIRSYNILVHLSQLGQVDLAFLTDEAVGRETLEPLNRICRRVKVIPISSRWRWVRAFLSLARGRSLTEGLFASSDLGALVGRWLDETAYDAIVCFSSGVLPYVISRGLESRLVVDLVDVDSQKWLDYARRTSGPKSLLFHLEGRRVRKLEREAERSRAVVFATEPEAAIYQQFCPDARIEAICNGVDLDYFRPRVGVAEDGGCVFVGQLDYRANVMGLEWFCREAWPLVRERQPDAILRLVGRNPVPTILRLGSLPGVEVVGPVADVRPYLASARVVVVPLPVARGVQNKILEAMAMARAVVASPVALEGLSLERGRHALSAVEPEDWSLGVLKLWNDESQRAEMGRAARHYVEENHRWATCLSGFDSLVGGGAN